MSKQISQKQRYIQQQINDFTLVVNGFNNSYGVLSEDVEQDIENSIIIASAFIRQAQNKFRDYTRGVYDRK